MKLCFFGFILNIQLWKVYLVLLLSTLHIHLMEETGKFSVRAFIHHSFIAEMNLILFSLIWKKRRKKGNKFGDNGGTRLRHMETAFEGRSSVFILLLSNGNPKFWILTL